QRRRGPPRPVRPYPVESIGVVPAGVDVGAVEGPGVGQRRRASPLRHGEPPSRRTLTRPGRTTKGRNRPSPGAPPANRRAAAPFRCQPASHSPVSTLTRPFLAASTTASRCECTPSLLSTLCTWLRALLRVTPIAFASACVDSPRTRR